jgi:hypothetical protein
MEARMCFEFKHGLADISKFYPSLLAILVVLPGNCPACPYVKTALDGIQTVRGA